MDLYQQLNIVGATRRSREMNPGIPGDLYVVEKLQIDGIVIWQSGTGMVFQTVMDGNAKEIYPFLAKYTASYKL